ncbi:MAG: hypothetical protein A2189_09040, partial [Paenibacillus sp. RIFOXYA1_FULL_44_5]
MRKVLDIQKQLLPDLVEVLKKRYTILQHVMLSGVVGRRTLAGFLNMTERVVRAEVDFLKEQGLLLIEPLGIKVSEAGRQLVEEMEPLIKDLFGLSELEGKIRKAFGLKQVIVVPGDADTSSFTKKEIGRAMGTVLRKFAVKGDVIAVTGGSTMAEAAAHLAGSPTLKELMFVPARGGLGESVEFQANTIASTMAKKTGGHYRMLHVPDHLSEETYQTIILEPNIQEIVEVIRSARIVLHGIGDAIVMARRRKVELEMVEQLRNEGALAEAYGYYFDRGGKIVHKMHTVGLRIEDIQKIEVVIAAAGGKSKAEAIVSVLRFGYEDILI